MAFATENFNKDLVLMGTGKSLFERSEKIPKKYEKKTFQFHSNFQSFKMHRITTLYI